MDAADQLNLVFCSGISSRAGGIFYAVRSLSQELNGKSVNIKVMGPAEGYSAEDQMSWGNVSVFPYQSFGPFEYSIEMRRLIRDANPKLVHQHGLWLDSQWATSQWQKRTGNPVVISPHGMLDAWALNNSVWKKKLVGRLFADKSLNEATCIHALCQSEAESIRAYGLENPIAIVPNGVDVPEISEQGVSRDRGEGKKTLLFLGRIHPKKGLKELLEAWACLNEVWRAEWQLLIAGWDDGGHESGLKDLAVSLGICHSVEFIGPKFGDEKESLLLSVDAFILPSFSEGLPMSVLEAWSYGLPVMMTDHCNLPEGFESDAAIRIHPDAGSISHGLEKLMLMESADRAFMGARGRSLIEIRFTWRKIADDMKQVYEWCINGGKRPECVEMV